MQRRTTVRELRPVPAKYLGVHVWPQSKSLPLWILLERVVLKYDEQTVIIEFRKGATVTSDCLQRCGLIPVPVLV